jgi:hypothetical protein
MTARACCPLVGSIHTYPSLNTLQLRTFYVTKNQSDKDEDPTVLTIKSVGFLPMEL